MKIILTQIYAEAGANFPFNQNFQQIISNDISSFVSVSDEFAKRFGMDYRIVIRISAKSTIDVMELVGPTTFKRDKSVEYTIFLPFKRLAAEVEKTASYESPFRWILEGSADCLERLGLDTSKLRAEFKGIMERLLNDKSIVGYPI